jgi:hypothetical protein
MFIACIQQSLSLSTPSLSMSCSVNTRKASLNRHKSQCRARSAAAIFVPTKIINPFASIAKERTHKSRLFGNRWLPQYAQSEQSVLSFIASRSSFLIGELLLGKLSETVVIVGNAPHDRPGFLVGHLIGNRASFLCTKAPMLRIPETNFLHDIRSISGRDVRAIFRRRHQHGFYRVPSSRVHFLDKSPQPPRACLSAPKICSLKLSQISAAAWVLSSSTP